MFNGIDKFTLIPPAWSLGVEVMFYLVFPFILLAGLRSHFIAISYVVFFLAAENIINPLWFGYFLPPGVIFIFLSGSLLFDYVNGNKKESLKIIIIYTCIAILFGLVIAAGKQNIQTNFEVFFGYLVGVPVLFCLSLFKRKKIDELMGNISYGVFLSHFMVKDCFRYFGLLELKYSYILYLMSVIMFGFIGFYLVERPVVLLRKRARQKLKTSSIQSGVR
jgi:peptidoglycan/LPS O-acetylase OafA/YrhL